MIIHVFVFVFQVCHQNGDLSLEQVNQVEEIMSVTEDNTPPPPSVSLQPETLVSQGCKNFKTPGAMWAPNLSSFIAHIEILGPSFSMKW